MWHICDKATFWMLRVIADASKRGEPLREGRLWRVDEKAGYPLADTVCATPKPFAQRLSRFDVLRINCQLAQVTLRFRRQQPC